MISLAEKLYSVQTMAIDSLNKTEGLAATVLYNSPSLGQTIKDYAPLEGAVLGAVGGVLYFSLRRHKITSEAELGGHINMDWKKVAGQYGVLGAAIGFGIGTVGYVLTH
jgi:hypothetical protein